MKEIIREWLPLWTVGFVGGAAIVAMIFIWAFHNDLGGDVS